MNGCQGPGLVGEDGLKSCIREHSGKMEILRFLTVVLGTWPQKVANAHWIAQEWIAFYVNYAL